MDQKTPSNSSETKMPNKKVALESTEMAIENVECSDCDVHIPTCWNISQYDSFKLLYDWLIVENKNLGCPVCKK